MTHLLKIHSTLPYPTLRYPTLRYPTLPYPTLPYPTLLYPTLLYPPLPYPILHYTTLFYPTLPYHIYPGSAWWVGVFPRRSRKDSKAKNWWVGVFARDNREETQDEKLLLYSLCRHVLTKCSWKVGWTNSISTEPSCERSTLFRQQILPTPLPQKMRLINTHPPTSRNARAWCEGRQCGNERW